MKSVKQNSIYVTLLEAAMLARLRYEQAPHDLAQTDRPLYDALERAWQQSLDVLDAALDAHVAECLCETLRTLDPVVLKNALNLLENVRNAENSEDGDRTL